MRSRFSPPLLSVFQTVTSVATFAIGRPVIYFSRATDRTDRDGDDGGRAEGGCTLHTFSPHRAAAAAAAAAVIIWSNKLPTVADRDAGSRSAFNRG